LGKNDYRPLEVSLMFVVSSRVSGTEVELWCSMCFRPLAHDMVLVFPSDGVNVEGHWMHKACVDGRIRMLLGTKRVTMMTGWAALSHLATTLRSQSNGHL
jgi:hypothetical protein